MSNKEELVTFLDKMGVAQKFRIQENFGNGYVRLNIEESERRQAKHDVRSVEDTVIELIRNSRDAGAKNILIASRLRNNLREIWIIDDGKGIPPELFNKIFEARVTSKVNKVIEDEYGIHGRGMALYAIKSHCKEASVLYSIPEKLTVIKITADTNNLKERSDQSTLPKIKKTKDENIFIGPLNIPKVVCQFTYKYPQINFFYGLPSQISGNLIKLSKQNHCFNEFEINNIEHFTQSFQKHFGFTISKRNAYRCISSNLFGVHFNEYLKKTNNQKYLREKGLSSLLDNKELYPLAEKASKNLEEIVERYNIKVVDASVVKKGSAVKIILALEKAEEI